VFVTYLMFRICFQTYVLAYMFPGCFEIFREEGRSFASKAMHFEVLLGASLSMVLNLYYMNQLCSEALKLVTGKGKASTYDEAESKETKTE